jgi:hypothetical protein
VRGMCDVAIVSSLHAHDEHYYKFSWIFLIFFVTLREQMTRWFICP